MSLGKMRWARVVGVAVLALALGAVGPIATSGAAEAKAKKAAAAAAEPSADPKATEIVQRMAERIVAADRLSLGGEIAWDVVQADGQTLEFGATREVVLQRPDHLRVEIDLREGGKRRLLYDGKQIVLADLAQNVMRPLRGPGRWTRWSRSCRIAWASRRALGVPFRRIFPSCSASASIPRATWAKPRSTARAATTWRCATRSLACSCGSARRIRCRAGSRLRTSMKRAGRSSARA